MLKKIVFVSLLFLGYLQQLSYAQQLRFSGRITDEKGEGIIAQISVLEMANKGTISDAEGVFELKDLPRERLTLKIQALGYISQTRVVNLSQTNSTQFTFVLKEDVLGLEQIVVSANRRAIAAQDAPIKVGQINQQILQSTQSISLSEGLNYASGLRLENNCQNCGFTQVRMNGLEGAYSQVLINSRPIFSALVGVYGLDFIPSNMIERVEVVRGAGSVLYGGNAIGGTINIITKEPTQNQFEIGTNIGLINAEKLDRTFSLNGSLVSKNQKSGISMYAFQREREAWDAIGDGFSEITKLSNTTVGFDASLKTSEWSKLKWSAFHIEEFRRGGNGFDLQPHQTDLAEQLKHQITGGNLGFEFFLPNRKHKFSIYTSAQRTLRDSYYGGGGKVLGEGDTLTEDDLLALNAYGDTKDIAMVTGIQYNFDLQANLFLTAGTEFQYNQVDDAMPGYSRLIAQKVSTWGSYAQLEWNPSDKWTLLLGTRFDAIRINGTYNIATENQRQIRTLQVPVPRFSVMYEPSKNIRIRAGYAQGYRAPQAFDEDFHIEVVGGAALFTRLAEDLRVERSHSATFSVDYEVTAGKTQMQFSAEGFYTLLDNPFITADPVELPSGVAVMTKRNGTGAFVSGTNLEARFFFSPKFDLQLGATLQQARYTEEEELWTPEAITDANQDSITLTSNLLRTPNLYGFFVANWKPIKNFEVAFSGVYTGQMDVPHIIEIDSEYTVIKRTPTFWELGTKFSYQFLLGTQHRLQVFAGVHNLLNSFQQDFDRGAERDAGYVYGPARPRTFFFGASFGWQ